MEADTAAGSGWMGALHPEDREKVEEAWREAVKSGREFHAQFRFVRPDDGRVTWVEGSGSRIENPQAGGFSYVGSCSAITEQKQAEARMRLYEGIFSTSPDFAYVFDTEHRFIYANRSLLDTWGRSWGESAGKTCLELGYEPWHAEMHNREIDAVVLSGRPVRGEIPFTGVNGRRIYEYIFTPVFGENGGVEAVAGTTRDVTERKEAEERANFLSELAGNLSPLTEEAEIIRVTVAATGGFLNAHRCYFVECLKSDDLILAGENWVRDDAVSLAGEYSLSAFGGDEWWAEYSGGDLAVTDVATHRLTRDRLESYEQVGVKSFAVQPFKRAGEWTAILAVTEDRTRQWKPEEMELLDNVAARVWPLVEQARSLESIRKSQQRLALVAEAGRMILESDTPAGMLKKLYQAASDHLQTDICLMLMPNRDGEKRARVEFASGLADEAVERIGRIYFGDPEMVLAADVCPDAARQKASRIFAEERVKGYSSHPLLVGDELLGIMIFASRVRGAFSNEEEEFLETISQYVTSAYVRLRLLDSLRESDRRKDQFLATLAHELRNPLAPILTGLEIMKHSKDDASKLDKITGIIERQTSQMARLIDDLLDISRVNTGKIVLRKETVPFGEILKTAIEASEPLFEKHGHALKLALPADPVRVSVDPSRVAQVISNLLTNAAKYTPPGGEILLEAAADDGDVRVKVRDNGQGIELSDQQSIFEIFHQTADGSADGLGIGLTLVKSLVELHGGAVTVRSEGKAKGSEFEVRLPACVVAGSEENAAPEPVTMPTKAEGPAVSKRVLVVDDGKSAADMLALFFRLQGLEVAVAYDGLEGLEKARDFQPDLVIMDIGMPLMDGLEAARRMRLEKVGATLVALSGWGAAEDKRRTAEAGFDEHLVKPVKPDDLRALMARYFD
jgi:PAS domain S-box-containing protein